MWIKVVVIILILAILFSLFRGLFFLTKGGEENSKKLLKSLTWRLGLSALLFIAVLLLHYFEVINLRQTVLPVDQTQQETRTDKLDHEQQQQP
ncbi:twin transmembrane helix small protein [Kangiella spongicola]|uniref:Twin transmembrane helix small protein n=1 Tax=Kangiella spongicola TaxID=796379 RepID=A0A318D417_9GAMM|nr:twin transmembrane helix small protein [Kangiella spongicola]PXF64056.1 twin transmembrane helix small protein [Kangiella spongicola]